ncbi:sodium-dependent organic anion transporter [Podarcis raffonei]|uniref:sodium-dependent organic anion transporter n=1 Tax=Podarcis raffonei TaxID=65483 RepID=UPI00232961D7|nr:sodium-dependent organic anion transporter [Podarcis raffonei]
MANNSGGIPYTNNGTSGNTDGQDYGSTIYDLVFSIVIAIIMGFILFSMGCATDMKKMWGHIKRPSGIAVGMVCQFGLMPLTAYILAINFPAKSIDTLATFIIGCSPGGSLSNFVSYWVDGDMDLSISMTALSNMAALGMMSLCLFICTRTWESEGDITVPYQAIGTTLFSFAIPIACGFWVKYRWPRQSQIILKVGSTIGGFLWVGPTVAYLLTFQGSWIVDYSLLMVSAVLPVTGYLGGFLLACLTCQSWQRSRTISVETGTQNLNLPIAVFQLSFSFQHFIQIYPSLVIYSAFQLLNLSLMVSGYQIYKKCLGRAAAAAEGRPSDPQVTMSGNLGGEINLRFEKEHEVNSKVVNSFNVL